MASRSHRARRRRMRRVRKFRKQPRLKFTAPFILTGVAVYMYVEKIS